MTVSRTAEIDRAKACREVGQRNGWSDRQIIAYYSIDKSVADEVFGQVEVQPTRRHKRADYRRMIERWCAERLFEEVTVGQVAEAGCVSPATARKFIEDRADLFRRLGRSTWEVRDPQADRQFERRQAT